MKKALLLTGLLLALVAPAAMAQSGVDFAWGTGCFRDAGATTAMTFACASNTSPGSWTMTSSFAPAADMPLFVAVEVLIEGMTDAATLPDWWKLATGCRSTITNGAVIANADFTTAAGGCTDAFGGAALGGPGFNELAGNRFEFTGAFALGIDTPSPLTAGTEYYAAHITFKNGKTVGTGSCPTGCQGGAILGLYSVIATQNDASHEILQDVIPGGNQCLTWNGSVSPCAQPVPTRNTTWGQVKSLYR